MTKMDRKLAKLEARVQMLENIKKGSKKFGSDHLGKKTKEIFSQEIKSLLSIFKPKTATQKEYKSLLDALEDGFENSKELSDKDQIWLHNELKQFQEKIDEIHKRYDES